ncbi:MAG TPA: hypothetical protein VN539_01110 [Candidatus Saccharimonadales bacterium]|nr:hypothetical protein [Candidatus Saccharimonadales bacterium]
MCTGISSRRAAAAFAVLLPLLLAPVPGRAQVFKLSTLRIPPDVAAGSWVVYEIDLVAKNRPPRRITQRLAVVSREGTGSEAGAWLEMKTTEAGRTRTERGFYMKPESKRDLLDSLYADDEAPAAEGAESPAETPKARPPKLRLARYQKLTPDGKLYEYPMEEEASALPEEDVTAMDMFEFSGRAAMDTLPSDTLRVGRKVVPCRVRRVKQYGAQAWEGSDSTYVNRAQMIRTYWRNPYIPVTGFAREVAEISSTRLPAAGTPTDSTAASATAPASEFFYRANLTLTDIGNNAVPEITQAPEPAPRESAPRPRFLDR